MDLVIQESYCRNYSREYGALANAMKEFYQCDKELGSLICPSGMSAISICLNVLHQGMDIVRTGELYCDTPRLLDSFGAKSRIFDSTILRPLFANKRVILFIESSSNPSGDIFDFKILPSLRKLAKQLIIIVDNTWLSHVIFNPMKFDVDIVINSLTKYYSTGACIAGSIVCHKQYYKELKSYMNINGIHTSPYHCQLVLNNLYNMTERIINASITVKEVATDVTHLNVRHASLISDPSHKLAEEFFSKTGEGVTIYPSVLTFKVKMSKIKAIEWMKSTGIAYETSFGSAYSKLDTWPKKCGDTVQCRLSVGYNDNAENIVCKLMTQ